jgi:signal transduction histidine kinase
VTEEESSWWRPDPVRRLAAFLWQPDERPTVSRAARTADAAIAVVAVIAAVVAVIEQSRTGDSYGVFPVPIGQTVVIHVPHGPGLSTGVVIGAALTAAPLAFRRTYPIIAFCVILAALFGTSGHTTSITVAAVIVAAYSAAAYSPYRRAALLSVLAGGVIVTAAYPNTTPPVPERYTALLILLPTVAVGVAIRVWRGRAGESAERLRVAEAEHEAQTRRAVALERTRIASEMHDVVTHNVSVMVIQAGAARRVLDSSPGDAREALLAVEASGRTAMTELRHLLGLLAPSGEGHGDAGEAPAADMTLTPQPGVARIPALVSRLHAAGMPVELSVELSVEIPGGTPPDLPPGVDLAAFRVVQEGLTNVMKHAGQARTTVRLDYGPRDLRITVSDDGSGARSDSGSGGRGLIGLRERIAVYGGELDAGPRPGGGWRLAARIPLQPAGGVEPTGGFGPAGGVEPADGFGPAGGVEPADGFGPTGGVEPAGGDVPGAAEFQGALR